MERYKVTIKPAAERELEDIPQKILRQVVRRIHLLSDNPRPPGVEKLSSRELYRIRQGDYRIIYCRIIYCVDDAAKLLDVVKVGHRREVYRAIWR